MLRSASIGADVFRSFHQSLVSTLLERRNPRDLFNELTGEFDSELARVPRTLNVQVRLPRRAVNAPLIVNYFRGRRIGFRRSGEVDNFCVANVAVNVRNTAVGRPDGETVVTVTGAWERGVFENTDAATGLLGAHIHNLLHQMSQPIRRPEPVGFTINIDFGENLARQRANERAARERLLANFTAEQRETYERDEGFEVRGGWTRRRYKICRGYANNIHVLDDGNKVIERLCAHPRGAYALPEPDVHLAQKLALECDEINFLETANVTPNLPLPNMTFVIREE